MASYWIAATSLGTIPSILVSIYSATFRPFYSEGALFSGAVLFFSGTGFLQWLFLRRIVRRAWLWLLAIAGALAFTFVITLMLILFSFIYGYEYNTAVSILMIGLLVGGSFGAFTGDALSRLLKQGI